MDRQEVITKLTEAIKQVQEACGRPSDRIDSNTRPIGDLEGFDSLSGVEATVFLSEFLGVYLSDDYNPFVSTDGRKALSVNEIADSVCTVILDRGNKNE